MLAVKALANVQMTGSGVDCGDNSLEETITYPLPNFLSSGIVYIK